MTSHAFASTLVLVGFALTVLGGYRSKPKQWGSMIMMAGVALSVVTTDPTLDVVGLLIMAVGVVLTVRDTRRATP